MTKSFRSINKTIFYINTTAAISIKEKKWCMLKSRLSGVKALKVWYLNLPLANHRCLYSSQSPVPRFFIWPILMSKQSLITNQRKNKTWIKKIIVKNHYVWSIYWWVKIKICANISNTTSNTYSHLSNNHGDWNT